MLFCWRNSLDSKILLIFSKNLLPSYLLCLQWDKLKYFLLIWYRIIRLKQGFRHTEVKHPNAPWISKPLHFAKSTQHEVVIKFRVDSKIYSRLSIRLPWLSYYWFPVINNVRHLTVYDDLLSLSAHYYSLLQRLHNVMPDKISLGCFSIDLYI